MEKNNDDEIVHPSKFIQVGCWNNLNKNKNNEEGCIKTVMKRIKSHIEDEGKKTDFIVLSGDNYYPKKIKKDGEKKKIIIKENLANGFKLLPDTLPIYMIMGNHDLETNKDKEELFVETGEEEEEAKEEVEKDCKIIDLEFESMKPNVEYNFFKDIMLKNGTLLLMIDTSIYEEDSEKYLPCYKKFFEKRVDKNIVKYDVSVLRNYQKHFINTSIENYSVKIKNIIIIGHHPIIYLRYKGGDDNETLSSIQEKFSPVLQNIYQTVNNTKVNNTKVKYYYLCSDLHLYQHGTIIIPTINQKNKKTQMVINQYVVGTGGAELDDPLLRPDSDKNKKNLLNYQSDISDMKYIVHEDIQACGFLVCDILDKEGPTFTPILFDKKGNKVNGGGSRKRRRMTKHKKLTKHKKRHYTKKI